MSWRALRSGIRRSRRWPLRISSRRSRRPWESGRRSGWWSFCWTLRIWTMCSTRCACWVPRVPRARRRASWNCLTGIMRSAGSWISALRKKWALRAAIRCRGRRIRARWTAVCWASWPGLRRARTNFPMISVCCSIWRRWRSRLRSPRSVPRPWRIREIPCAASGWRPWRIMWCPIWWIPCWWRPHSGLRGRWTTRPTSA